MQPSIICDKAWLIVIYILSIASPFVTASPSRADLPNLNTHLAYVCMYM